MAELEHHQKEQIVVLLAKFRTPSEIAALLKQEAGIDLTVQQISKYDPSRTAFDAGERWRPIFEAARKQYLTAVEDVPIANQGYRLQLLQEASDAARRARNWKLMAELLEQAAKEVGGVLTNQREMAVADFRPVRAMTAEERIQQLGLLISEAIQRTKKIKAEGVSLSTGSTDAEVLSGLPIDGASDAT